MNAESNKLFPIFLKLEELQLLIIGGGNTALEKLNSVLSNSPQVAIRIVAKEVINEIFALQQKHFNINIVQKEYNSSDIGNANIIIVAANNKQLSAQIKDDAHQQNILVNVADTPDLCDFYLSSVVQKGNLKIAISTNGKSPTLAKRLKEIFTEVLPAEIDEVLDNLQIIRNKLKGNFADKVTKLNEITKVLSTKNPSEINQHKKVNKTISLLFIIAIISVLLGLTLSLAMPVEKMFNESKNFLQQLDNRFYWMLLVGFGVEMIAGSMGMGYGVICTSVLLSLGLSLPVISSSVHTSEMFGSAASAISHLRYGNINKKLFKSLAIPGVITAVAGALFLIKFGEDYAHYFKPIIALYTFFLGVKIFTKAFEQKKKAKGKLKYAVWLGAIGGFIDSVGGGGWGPLVTSTVIAKGRAPRYAVGTSVAAKFCITVASAFTFFTVIGISQWPIIVGLIIGGVLAAPLAAKLTGKLPTKGMFIAVGALVIGISFRILLKSFHVI
jgi:siroheme synthase-like protein